jgi:hypothetical protein
MYKYPGLFKATQGLVRLADTVGMGPIILWLKNVGIRDRFFGKMRVPIRYPKMEDNVRVKLKTFYSEPNRQLAASLGMNLPLWY